jgi:outer membrane receptor protein involved in Fe transport
MKISTKLRLSAGSLAVGFALATVPAFAQDAEQDNEEAAAEDAAVEEDRTSNSIIVSGSRIRRDANLDSVAPIISVSADEILDDGSVSLGDALNDLPALRSTFNSSNSQRFIGTTGLSLLDLRGLGTTRTLTLVNGRRHITADLGGFAIDINTIPTSLLEQIDVVTGGSSAVYGSDAIAGVVNFVLRDDYEGLELSAVTSISDRGDGRQFGIDAVWGKNFADGRGNITVAADYSRAETVLNSQRPENSGFGIGFTGFVVNPDDTTDEGLSNTNGVPDNILVSGQRLDFLSEGGTVQTFCIFGAAVQPLACDSLGNERRFRFGPDGRLFDEVTTQFPANGRAIDGDGTVLSDGSLLPEIERYTVNVLGKFDVSDAFQPFFEFKFARIEAFGEGTPSFFNGICGGLGGATGLGGAPACAGPDATTANFFIPFDNAFLNPDDVAQIAAVQNELLAAFGVPPVASGFFINRNNSDFGTRNDDLKRDTYRLVAGIKGDISDNTRYEVSFNYGRFETFLNAQNDLIFANARAAIDSIIAPDGSIQCRVNADADTTNDLPGCVPINPFGFGSPSAEALAFINNQTTTLSGEAEQYNVLAFIATDSSSFFELPGGPIGLVVGGEWRRETAFEEPDALSSGGATFFNAFDVFDPPAFEVYEAFGEIDIPLLRDTPFFQELTLKAAGRISDYGSGAGETGRVEAWNVSGLWAPIEDVRFRANLSRAIRAPTPSNLFSPQTVNFLFFDDPCDVDFIDQGTANRAANCLADGVPAGFDESITGNRAVLQGGNQLLSAETSDSFTAGIIFQPSFLPGFSVSADYYDIEVESVIANVGPQAILNNCYDAVDLNNSFCGQIFDRQADGSLQTDAALITGPVNFAKLTAEGIDIDARYSHTFENGNRLQLRAIATHVLDRTNFLDTDNPEIPDDDRGELGDPIWAANFNVAYTFADDFTLSWAGRYVGPQFIGARENYRNSIQPCNADGTVPRTSDTCTPGTLVEAPPLNPDAFPQERYPSRFTQDIRLDIQATEQFRFTVGVDNVTDKQPPFGLTGAGGGSGIFDNRGRTVFAVVRYEM